MREAIKSSRTNSRGHCQLERSGICRALVSEKDAGSRTARLVRATFRNGRGKLDFLLSPRDAHGRTMVRGNAKRFPFRRKAASAFLVSRDTGEIVASRIAKARPGRCERKSDGDGIVAGRALEILFAANVDLAIGGKARRFPVTTFARILAAKARVARVAIADREAHRLSIGD